MYERCIRQVGHIFIYGEPNCGKSTVAKSIVNVVHHKDKVFSCRLRQNNKFMLSGLNPEEHELIIIDEFTPAKYREHAETYNMLLSGESLSIDEKCMGKVNRVCWNKPIIIISNYEPENDNRFTTRIHVIHADTNVPNLIKRYCEEKDIP